VTEVHILFHFNIVLYTQRDVLYQNLRLAELITKLLGKGKAVP